jgi:hypothetical protein
MQPYMQELMVWDEQEQRTNFATQWKPEEVRSFQSMERMLAGFRWPSTYRDTTTKVIYSA